MLSSDFRDLLEYRLTTALAASVNPELRQYWCDGVLEPEWESDYLPVHVTQTGCIVLRAWMEGAATHSNAKTHQQHPLHLVLGPTSLKDYLNGQDLRPLIENGIDPDAIELQASEKAATFVIYLP